MNDEEKPDSDDGLQEGSRSADDEVTFGKTLTQVASSEWSVPSQIGPYRLLQRIGSGGMGEVWVAEQSAPVKRRVALKLIKEGFGSKEVIARFEAERQALALMNHPNIARILDAGTTDQGQPYFVMELVSGKPLTTYCDENRLSIDQRLKLFMQACSGVQHAHQKGIIHRDLKPGNIIVGMQDGEPVPKVIDFGLAKAMENTQRLTDQSLFTGIGQILGTLKYMSPEQASLDNLDIDTRTDIYALGVILYELLTGSTPLEDSSIRGQAAMKVLEIIRDKDPVKPSSRLSSSTEQQVSTVTGQRRTDSLRLKRALLGDLDWIVMKALDKDRTRRYESASGFAADIGRFLNSEPVVARPPSMTYRVQKFVRKNRGFVFAVTTVASSILLGLVGTIWFAIDANKAKEIANRETQRALEKEKIALENQQHALNAVDDFFLIVSEEGLIQKPGLQGLRTQLLSKASDYYERLLTEKMGNDEGDTELLLRKLDVQIRYARMLNALGNLDKAKSTLDIALKDSERLTIAKNTPKNHVETLARLYDILSSTNLSQGQLEEAEEACRIGLQRIDDWHSFDSTAPQLGIQVDLLLTFAQILQKQGRISDARAKLLAAKDIATSSKLSDRRESPVDLLAEVLVQLSQIAVHKEAIEFLQEAIEIRSEQLRNNPDDSRNRLVLGETLTNLAWSIRSQDPERAMVLFEEADVLINSLHHENPSVIFYSNALSKTLDLAAYTKHQYGLVVNDAKERHDLLQQSLALYEKAENVLTAAGKNSSGVLDPQRLTSQQQALLAMIFNGQALVGRDLGELTSSLERFERAFEIQRLSAQLSPNEVRNHRDMAGTQHNMGRTLLKFGKFAEAADCLERAVRIVEGARIRFPEAEYLVFDLANSQSELNYALIMEGDLQKLQSMYVPTAPLWKQAEAATGKPLTDFVVIADITDHAMQILGGHEVSLVRLFSSLGNHKDIEPSSLIEGCNRVSKIIDLTANSSLPPPHEISILTELGREIVKQLRTEHGFTDLQLSGFEHLLKIDK